MKKKLFYLVTLLSIFFVSCKPSVFYQVYETVPKNLKNESSFLVYEDNQCTVTYNLWSNGGNPGFVFHNKTNELIYVLLDESFFVLNGTAYDYFQNRVFSSSSATATQSTKTNSLTQWGGWLTAVSAQQQHSISFNSQNGVTEMESKTISIPPRTSKQISEFKINDVLFRSCDLFLYPTNKQIKSLTYNEENTPVQFYNFITYKVGQTSNRQVVRHDFYISSITNYSEKDFYRLESDEFCGKKSQFKKQFFNHNAPERFYFRYVKNTGDTNKH